VIKLAQIEDKETIFSLLQPYLKELSLYPDEQIDGLDEKGIYHYPYLDAYWIEIERFPYLLICNGEIGGFALVRKEGAHWEMTEFYIKPEFRCHGLGTECATEILRTHPGKWMIEFNTHNRAGKKLWYKLAKNLSNNGFVTGNLNNGHEYVSFSY
jgi:predicted acetyltransferase